MIGVYAIGTDPEDSFAACLASILELPAGNVPVPFHHDPHDRPRRNVPGIGRPPGVWEAWNDWLYRFGLVLWEYNREEGLLDPPGYGIATYLTERGLYSVVLMQRTIVWDPHRPAIAEPHLGHPVAVAMLVVIDPAELARELPPESPSVLATLRLYVRPDR